MPTAQMTRVAMPAMRLVDLLKAIQHNTVAPRADYVASMAYKTCCQA